MNNGCIAFQYCPDGTNLLNQKWMERKFNTVSMMERSSLLSALTFEQDHDTLEIMDFQQQIMLCAAEAFPFVSRETAW